MSIAISRKLLSNRKALYGEKELCSSDPIESIDDILFTFVAELNKLGYQFSENAQDYLRTLSVNELTEFRSMAKTVLEEALGADVKYVPLFRKFPESIPDRSLLVEAVYESLGDLTHLLFFNFYGYWSSSEYNGSWFGRQYPDLELQEAIKRPELITGKELTTLDIVGRGVVLELFENLANSKTSTSASDKEFINSVIATGNDWKSSLPEVIPSKENLVHIIGCAATKSGPFDEELQKLFSTHIKTATDVLRLAASFSGSDVALTKHTRFKISNSQRKFLLFALNKLDRETAMEDILRFLGLWLVLAKYLHVNAYASRYPNAAKMIQTIRGNQKSIKTFNRTIETALRARKDLKNEGNMESSLESIIHILKARPGDFARRLDHLLRSYPSTEHAQIVISFLDVASSVSTPLLLNLSTHFQYRHEISPIRVFLPKGSATNAIIEDEDERQTYSSELCSNLYKGIDSVLIERFSKLEPLGNIFIDPILEDYIPPIGLRDASEALHTFGRGSKMRFDKNSKVIRLFLYWENIKETQGAAHEGRVDVDLSCLQLSDNFENKGEIAYYNLANGAVTHSGDFTDATNGAAEFIDVKLDDIKEAFPETRYIAVTVNSYTGQKFNTFTAKAGFMIRDNISGEHFEPKTVEQKFDLLSASRFNIPMVLDLYENTIIWLDLAISQNKIYNVNLHEKTPLVGSLAKYALNIYREKCNLLKLMQLHGEARAQTVSAQHDPEKDYDHCFDKNFASKTDEIVGNFLI